MLRLRLWCLNTGSLDNWNLIHFFLWGRPAAGEICRFYNFLSGWIVLKYDFNEGGETPPLQMKNFILKIQVSRTTPWHNTFEVRIIYCCGQGLLFPLVNPLAVCYRKIYSFVLHPLRKNIKLCQIFPDFQIFSNYFHFILDNYVYIKYIGYKGLNVLNTS